MSKQHLGGPRSQGAPRLVPAGKGNKKGHGHPAEGACLVCGKPLVYGKTEVDMECAICHEKKRGNARCADGHFVCDACHQAPGARAAAFVARNTEQTDPIAIAMEMMDQAAVHMHGPEHHILAGMALLAAYRGCGGDLDLPRALEEMEKRGAQVPGGTCGYWGTCGAAVSAGIAASILTGTTPLTAGETYGFCNQVVSDCLSAIAKTGGPRCCKRNTFLSLLAAAPRLSEVLGVAINTQKPVCSYFSRNGECLGGRCPFFPQSAS